MQVMIFALTVSKFINYKCKQHKLQKNSISSYTATSILLGKPLLYYAASPLLVFRSLSLSQQRAVIKWLNRSRCRFIRWLIGSPQGKEQFWGTSSTNQSYLIGGSSNAVFRYQYRWQLTWLCHWILQCTGRGITCRRVWFCSIVSWTYDWNAKLHRRASLYSSSSVLNPLMFCHRCTGSGIT